MGLSIGVRFNGASKNCRPPPETSGDGCKADYMWSVPHRLRLLSVDIEDEKAIEQGRLAIEMPLGEAGARRLLRSVIEKPEPK